MNARGITSLDEIESTICKSAPYDSFLMTDMQKACERISKALQNDESILIYGDYDCDGICATTILYEYFENENAKVSYYIPNRHGEGYGLGKTAIDLIISEGIDLVITVDNGISALDEIAELTKNDVDIIVTDHHKPKDTLPDCVAILNPHRPDESYPEAVLCGAGVAFKLISALEHGEEYVFEQYGDLVAVATLGDIMPLHGENRYLVKRGLSSIASTHRTGLRAIMNTAGIDLEGCVSARQVSFGIVPRINAVGRLGEVDTLIELLLSSDEALAEKLAVEVDSINTKRKNICDTVFTAAKQYITQNPELLCHRVIVVVGEDWHHGVIGIVAAKLLEIYNQPVIVLTKIGDELRASARSVEGFSIIEAVTACAEHLTRYGGHKSAAGFSLYTENLQNFLNTLHKYSDFCEQSPYRRIVPDTTATLSELNLDTVRELALLEPFGPENTNPIILLQNIYIKDVYPIANGTGSRLTLTDGKTNQSAVSFGTSPEEYKFLLGIPLNVATELSENEYNGSSRLSIRVVAIVPCCIDTVIMNSERDIFIRAMYGESTSGYSFSRSKLVLIYKLLKHRGTLVGDVDILYLQLKDRLAYFDVLAGVAILEELGLVKRTLENGTPALTFQSTDQKLDIKSSPCFGKLLELGLAENPD